MQAPGLLKNHLLGDSDQNWGQWNGWGDGGPQWNGGAWYGGAAAPVLDTEFYKPASSTTSSGTSTTSSGGSTGSLATGNSSTSPFVINVVWDSSVSSAPAGFTSAIMSAVQFLESQFSNPVTITIDVGYGECHGNALGSGTLGQSSSYMYNVGYSSLVSALKSHATTPVDQSAVASLPSSSPVNGSFWTTSAELKGLGLGAGWSPDGFVGFASGYSWTYDNSGGVAAGTFDLQGVALHEITEVMGRDLEVGGTIGGVSNSYEPLDLFHYAAPGVRDFTQSTAGYLSADGGVTDSGDFNTASGGDAGDWASNMGNDAFNAFGTTGVVNAFSADDLIAMNLAGWMPAGSIAPPPPPTAPTGVSYTAVTNSVASGQTAGGLAGNVPITTVAQTGGTSGDSFTYALGGSGAASFAITSSNNVGTLSAGASGVAGAVNGAVYGLTVTATDTTNGMSSSPMPIDVVVGSSSADTINLASLIGSGSTATPTFVFGLGYGDTINGTGMTSKLWMAGGTGADVMSGGSGVNDYMYGSASESTPSAMDIITNFHAADLIDLTGMGTSLSYAGNLPTSVKAGHGKTATTSNQVLPGNSVGWQQSGGNTFVYVNTTSSSVAVGSANMAIELQGSISLASANFLHH